jgi:hypothetical protein
MLANGGPLVLGTSAVMYAGSTPVIQTLYKFSYNVMGSIAG